MCWVMPPASRAGHVGFADGVEQRGLAVVHVAHDGDHRGALLQVLGVLGLFDGLHGFHFVADGGRGGAEFARHFGGQLGIQRLVDGGEDAAVQQLLDHQVGLHVQLFGKLLHGDAFRNGDFAIDGRRTGFHLAARGAQDLLFLDALARLRPRGRLSPGRPRGWSTGGGAMPGSMRPARGGMLGPRTPGRRRAARRGARPSWPPWAGRGEWARDKWAGRGLGRRRGLGIPGRAGTGAAGMTGPGRAEPGREIGTRRHYRARGRLAGQRAPLLSGSRCGRSGSTARLAGRLGTPHGRSRALGRGRHPGQRGTRAFRGRGRARPTERAGADRRGSALAWPGAGTRQRLGAGRDGAARCDDHGRRYRVRRRSGMCRGRRRGRRRDGSAG